VNTVTAKVGTLPLNFNHAVKHRQCGLNRAPTVGVFIELQCLLKSYDRCFASRPSKELSENFEHVLPFNKA
jgi:hypothetical protein